MPAAAMSHLPVVIACPVSMPSNGGVDDLLLEVELLGDQIHQVDVEADDLAVLLYWNGL